MQNLARLIAIVAAVLFVGLGVAAQAQERNIAQGEIVRVDSAARTISIRTDTGSQMEFVYTDDTVVKGAEDSIAGLATRQGMLVSITYQREDSDLIAKEIAIQRVDEEPEQP